MKIGVSNLKGGVGKTTVSQNIAVCFAHLGYKTCILDTDRNQNSISWSGVRDEELPEILVVGSTDERAITKAVNKLNDSFDFVVIDGTPSLSEMTTRVILASDLLIIPILPSAHDIRAIHQFIDRYQQALEFRDDIPAYFFVNQFQGYTVQKSIRDLLLQFGLPILQTTFRERVAYVEAAVEGRGVIEWTDEKAAEEAVALTNEVLFAAEKHGFIKQEKVKV
ncbi:MAG: AAA family ATPase [Lewinellaceae bacterium]|nr:AAA family ATPase [Saprospiraceae bacterium]MCB9342038.1 AAA family ATPase [Lewinellaceae bacterium]